jgi:cytidylate kinase
MSRVEAGGLETTSRTVLYRELEAPGSGGRVFRLDQPVIITIDGPAGTGKSSVARALAKRLGLDFLDTGAMYRAAAAISLDQNIPITESQRLVDAVKQADIHFDWTKDPPQILASGRSLNARIRDPDVTAVVSPVSAIGALRQHMVAKQRVMAKQHPRLVSEGRDQGSVVFPDASVKFYLDASAQVRAARRAQQLRGSGQPADEAQLLQDIIARDKSDMGRADGPLVRPAGGIVLDTSDLDFVQVVDELERAVREKAAEP